VPPSVQRDNVANVLELTIKKYWAGGLDGVEAGHRKYKAGVRGSANSDFDSRNPNRAPVMNVMQLQALKVLPQQAMRRAANRPPGGRQV
jgi:hypothetical protein